MPEKPPRPLLERLGTELGALGTELRQSAALRWQLAVLEIKTDLCSARRLLIVVAVAVVMGLTAVPLLLAALAHGLDGCWGLSSGGWLAVFGSMLAIAVPIAGLLAWRRFRRRFVGLRQTLDELHEDALWMQEWLERKEQDE